MGNLTSPPVLCTQISMDGVYRRRYELRGTVSIPTDSVCCLFRVYSLTTVMSALGVYVKLEHPAI